MATSSITHNFVITDEKAVKRFIKALDEADRNRVPNPKVSGHLVTDPQEFMDLMAKRKKSNNGQN